MLLKRLVEAAMIWQRFWTDIYSVRCCEGWRWCGSIEMDLFVMLKVKLELELYMISRMAFQSSAVFLFPTPPNFDLWFSW
jgi:hypothetical protein